MVPYLTKNVYSIKYKISKKVSNSIPVVKIYNLESFYINEKTKLKVEICKLAKET